jgi:CheY-like chemotaxis protein
MHEDEVRDIPPPTGPVLVVDDQDDVRDAIATLLETAGYDVSTAEHGRAALDRIKRQGERPCLILLDLMMPVMDGVEFRERQLADPDLATIPVVIVSAFGQHPRTTKVLRAEAYIGKPIDVDMLLENVASHCTRQAV